MSRASGRRRSCATWCTPTSSATGARPAGPGSAGPCHAAVMRPRAGLGLCMRRRRASLAQHHSAEVPCSSAHARLPQIFGLRLCTVLRCWLESRGLAAPERPLTAAAQVFCGPHHRLPAGRAGADASVAGARRAAAAAATAHVRRQRRRRQRCVPEGGSVPACGRVCAGAALCCGLLARPVSPRAHASRPLRSLASSW
jgi:hypothetical protein